MLDKLILPILSPLLDRLGTGWKSALGLLVMAGLLIANLAGYLDESSYAQWFGAAGVLFGIGIYHKQAQNEKPKE